MDLYDTLSAIINTALEAIKEAEAYELSHILSVAHSIRQQAIDVDETRLLHEADRLLHAVEREIEDRGGKKYMDEKRLESLEYSIADLGNLTTVEIIERIADLKFMEDAEGTNRDALKKYIKRAEDELKHRGVKVQVEFREFKDFSNKFKDKKAKVFVPPGPVPLPSEIINGTTPDGIPNT